AKRVADAAEAKRIADAAEAKRIADAAEAKRVADAAEARRLADQRAADLRDFNALLARAGTAYNQKNWGSAADLYGQAKQKLSSEFTAKGLQPKLDDATKKKADSDFFGNSVKAADSALASKDYAGAKTNYQSAKDRLPAEFANRKLEAKLQQA